MKPNVIEIFTWHVNAAVALAAVFVVIVGGEWRFTYYVTQRAYEERLDTVHVELQFVDERLNRIEKRLAVIEGRTVAVDNRTATVDGRLERIEQRLKTLDVIKD